MKIELYRSDLKENAINKKISEITMDDFNIKEIFPTYKPIQYANTIVFLDSDGAMKYFKHRFPIYGNVFVDRRN